ncbi:secretion system protein [Eubacterium sp. AF17-7]|uniref:type II secretion system F family protein n=2 Tax=Eubacteriaceae TaxID=186806 RepID=UPI000E4A68BB|nr:type II secretion system F family protein [Eubacterium sp. AF17-7]RGG62885.1 secretion system protein [Eubacterium sp. AF17-7]
MNGLLISMIFFVVVMMGVTFVLVTTIVAKITENSRNVKRREDYIVGKKKEEKKVEKTGTQKDNRKQSINNNRSALTKINKILAEELEKSDISKKTEDFIIIWIVVTFVPGLLFMLIFKNQLIAPMLMIIGAVAPIMYMKSKQKKRRDMFESQLSDALMIASNCLKSGLTFNQAMDTISSECDDPIKSEFKRTVNEITFGSSQDEALEAMAKRVKSEDFDLVVSAVSIQRQTGGNLSEILDTIAGTIRERYKIKGEIKTMTGQGRVSGMIIGVLPIALLLIMSLINKELIMTLFTTTIGKTLIIISVCLETVGAIVINKIVTIKF